MRPPARLRRVRGEHQVDGEPVTSARASARGHAAAAERPDRRADRAVQDAARRGPAAPSQPADALLLLGQVGQQEVQRERADQAPRRPRRSRASSSLREGGAALGWAASSTSSSRWRCAAARSWPAAPARPGPAARAPGCSTITWPRSAPRSLTSRASGSRAPGRADAARLGTDLRTEVAAGSAHRRRLAPQRCACGCDRVTHWCQPGIRGTSRRPAERRRADSADGAQHLGLPEVPGRNKFIGHSWDDSGQWR